MACPLKVAVRLRPPQPHDGKVSEHVLRCCDEVTLETDGQTFAFDRVFGPVGRLEIATGLRSSVFGAFREIFRQEASQQEVYSACAADLVDAVIEGTNACTSTKAFQTRSLQESYRKLQKTCP